MPRQSEESYAKTSNTMRENNAVENYLQYVTNGVLPMPAIQEGQIEALDERITTETRLFAKTQLIAKRHQLANPQPKATGEELTEEFVKHAPGFSEHNGVTYAVWREMGVPPDVLRRAGFQGTYKAPKQPKLGPTGQPRTRRTWTPEFAAEFMAVYETAAETDGHQAGIQALVDRYHYASGYMEDIVRKWQQGWRGASSPRQARGPRGPRNA